VAADLINTYVYDAEGRICAMESVDPVTGTLSGDWTGYLYDAAGNRVAKGNIKPVWVYVPSLGKYALSYTCDITVNGFMPEEGYVVGPAGEQLSEMKWVNNGWSRWEHTNVYAGGKLIGTYDGNASAPTLHFHIDDPLGTRRAQVAGSGTNAGTLEAVYQSLPFGDGYNWNTTTGDDPTENQFTGKERDTESGNDYFLARYYNSASGRFLSPDWDAKSDDPVPYAKLDNPQTLNLYAYVGNNPVARMDADGHSTLTFDGEAHTVTLYDKSGKEVGHWETYNNVSIQAPKGEGFQGRFTNGPILDGIYQIRQADQKGGKLHVGEPADSAFGSKGVIHLDDAKTASGATVQDDALHAGRAATKEHDQPQSKTGGCARTTPDAMDVIQALAPKDPLQTMTVKNNQKNVQQWQKDAKARGDKIP